MTVLATLPKFTNTDIKNARAYHIAFGEPSIGVRGRLPMWALLDWDRALRPVVATSEIDPKPRNKGGGRRSTVVDSEGVTVVVSKAESQAARRWAVANDITIPKRGRLSVEVLQSWVNAGKPEIAIPPVEKATVYYVKKNALTGNLYSKIHAVTVYDHMLNTGNGRPPMHSYWDAVKDGLPITAVPVRITTGGMIIDVSPDMDTPGDYVYRWVSKRDSATVMRTLLGNLATT